MLRTIIIDDEAHIRDTLTRLLARHCPQVSVVGEASGVTDGIHAIQDLHPDLVFLDINLEDGTGFDLLHKLNSTGFRLIFISAGNKNTIQAFRLSGLRYMSKPIDPLELATAVNHARITEQDELVIQLKALEGNLGN